MMASTGRGLLREGLPHLLIAVVATFPLVLGPWARLIGHPDADLWNHAWGPWWYAHSLSQGTLPYHTDLLMAPQGGPLWFIDPVGAALTAPLVPLLGVVLGWNLLILAQLGFASWAARALARALGASAAASWVAAIALACSPFLLSEVHNGVSEAVGVGWPLLAMVLGLRALERDRWRDWAVAGLALGLAGVASYYYGLAAGVVLAGWILLLPGPAWHRRLAGGALLGATAALLVIPAGIAIHHSVVDPAAIIARAALGPEGREMLMAHNAVDPRSFLMPGDFQSVDLAAQGEAFRHSAYLGLAALGLAIASRRWRVLLAALVVGVLALGPWLWWDGAWLTTAAGARLALPTRALELVLPAVATTHFQRLAMPLVAVVAALAAVGATRLPRRWIPVAILAVAVDGLLIGPSPWPHARAPAVDWSAHRAIGERSVDAAPGTAIVLDLPVEVGATMAPSRYLLYQSASGLPIPNRVDPRVDTASIAEIPAYKLLAAPSVTRRPHADALRESLRGLGGRVGLRDLSAQGVRWIVLHPALCANSEAGLLEAQLEAWLGPAEAIGDKLVWDLDGAPGDGPIVPALQAVIMATPEDPGG
jgi:hypothetical protein